jgi:lactate permease
VVALVIPQIEAVLEQFEVGFPFPAVETGYGVTEDAEQPYSPFAPFTHPGTFLLISHWPRGSSTGRRATTAAWSEREDSEPILPAVLGDAIPASLAVIAFLVMSTLMDHSGQTEVLAMGIAAVAPPLVFAFASNWIGVLGAFMTSSNTAIQHPLRPAPAGDGAALEGL